MEMDDKPGEIPSFKCVVAKVRKTKFRFIRIKASFYHQRP